ncbi:hypothetical protein IPM62_00770 [Candidatus Woesebacteria bacterium]|nr:MAG: hypothetical protein IPM62_00770 [Candidatus Woesebacteria bacterium]
MSNKHIVLAIVTLFTIFQVVNLSTKKENRVTYLDKLTNPSTPTPTPYIFPYKIPQIPKSRSYRTVIVGDSIVESLGLNANILREYLIYYYPDSEFVNYNYGYGATNILSLPERLTSWTKNRESSNQAILKQGFELIILESFAYNPLSEYPLEEGLKMQTDVLEQSVLQILKEKPGSVIAFMTPIAPNPDNFARDVYHLSQEQSSYWVKERIAYIENHKRFALEKGIPLIDVYTASLKDDGLVDTQYISNDFIHPSNEGLNLMSRQIADFIYYNKIFPE